MTSVAAEEFLPVELVFNPSWWYHTAGISFDAPFYLDAQTRIQNDVIMRRVLYERYGEFGEVIVEVASVARRCPMLSSTCASVRCACSGVPPREMAEDTEKLLLAAGPLEQAGVCCINMDYGTPDDNIFAMFEVVQRYRGYGA